MSFFVALYFTIYQINKRKKPSDKSESFNFAISSFLTFRSGSGQKGLENLFILRLGKQKLVFYRVLYVQSVLRLQL